MILNRYNCSNPLLWGKEVKWVIDGEMIKDSKMQLPTNVDFLKLIHGNFWPNAKEYYKSGQY